MRPRRDARTGARAIVRTALRAAWALGAGLALAASPTGAQTASAQTAGARTSAARVTAEQAMTSGTGVRAFVRVTDADGRPVRPDSAALAPVLDGRRAALVSLSTARSAPLGVVFVVCLDRAQPPTEVSETVAAFVAFADALTAPGDRAALVTCGDQARIVRPWSAPADIRRALDGLRATDDAADEAEALRLAATLPGAGLRRLALVRTDGRHLDPATETDVAAAGLPVFPIARPGTADALPLVTLARATGGAPLDGAPGPALVTLRERLAAAWQLDLAAPGDTAEAAPSWFSVRVGAVTSSRVHVSAAPALAPVASAVATPTPAKDGPNVLLWLTLGALAIAAVAGWVFFGARIRARMGQDSMPLSVTEDADAGLRGPAIQQQRSPLPAPVAPLPRAPGDAAAEALRVRLVGADGRTAGVAVLDRPRVVGRAEGVDVRIADPSVSARHAEVSFDGGRVHIRDLGSTNGLVVEGVATREAVLAHGDRVVLGETPLVVEIDFPTSSSGTRTGPDLPPLR